MRQLKQGSAREVYFIELLIKATITLDILDLCTYDAALVQGREMQAE